MQPGRHRIRDLGAAAAPAIDKRVLIVARSGRSLAHAAVEGGWAPWVIDAFGDLDTRAVAYGVIQLTDVADFQFDGKTLLEAIGTIQHEAGPMPVVLGSGFEARADVVAAIASSSQIHGNGSEVISSLADMPAVYDRLDVDNGACMPLTLSDRADDDHAWLVKAAGHTGGAHVRFADNRDSPGAGHYFQQHVPGRSISGLFLAGASGLRLCGISAHLQWRMDPVRSFRYEGARSLIEAPESLLIMVQAMGAEVARKFGIIGCFGIDFIQCADDGVALIDINPRPTATLDLYSDKGAIFNAHMAACTTGELLYSRPARATTCGHLVLYAETPWTIPERIVWPHYVADQPAAGTVIGVDAPLCTLHASADSAMALMSALVGLYDTFREFVDGYREGVLPREKKIRAV